MANKFQKSVVIGILISLALTGTLAAGEWKSLNADEFLLEWMVDGANLQIKVSAPTEGWISVGFDPTNKMKDANILIGYVENGVAVVEDHFGNGRFSHRSDEVMGGSNDLMDVSGSESGGSTELRFTIPLDSGDSKDRVLREGGQYTVIFASHRRDRITAKHSSRTSATIVL